MTMSEPFVVEVWGEPVGVVLAEERAFRFHALAQPFFALHGTRFRAPGQARLAAARLQAESAAATAAAN